MHRPVDDAAVEALRALAASAETDAGHPVLGDGVWRDLAAPSSDSAIVLASDGTSIVGALHLAAPDDDHTVTGSLVLARATRGGTVEAALVRTALADLAGRGIARLEYWIFGECGDATHPCGAPWRELHQMRVDLPLTGTDGAPRWQDATTVRPFIPGADDASWLAVNNRAFAADPDQGGWTGATLAARIAEPWFDADGFLVTEGGDGFAGFCWTKVHPPAPPSEPRALGEIYVIGVDPTRQGTGLGRALVVAGLASLAGRGITVGMLFVDAANESAVGLYEALGFVAHRTDRAYRCPVVGDGPREPVR